MRTRAALVALAGALALCGCGPLPAPSSPPSPRGTPPAVSSTATVLVAPSGSPGLPVDPSIAAVSISSHPADAEAAFVACNLRQVGLDHVAGMGLIPSASDMVKYAPLSGREPELRLPGPAWVVQLRGEIPMLLSGETWIDPICFASGAVSGYFAVGGAKDSSGAFHAPLAPATPPVYSLPPLDP